ncbi:MAG: hypothetical protein BGP08_04695 [Rhizobiales bacterium 64-17]|nr:MAG: hypothetical protein BGP08_04695 [Rhizobiales bacterium 64-17]
MVRKGYLERGKGSDGSGRGREPFVAVDWDFALDLAADAIHDVRARRGDSAVYGSSYGWSSAGRFHHAQSQIHRFLRLGGGYTDSVNDYSAGAGLVIVPHITGMQLYTACGEAPPARDIADHCKLILCFGGIGLKNNQVSPGGIGSHDAEHHLRTLKEAGVHFINVSAVRDDAAGFLEAEWLPCRPGSDVALMLGLAHTLLVNGLHDTDFLNRYCHGFDHVADYLLGKQDGVAKDANWAASLTTVPADKIRDLALRLSRERSIIGLSLSVQRGEHGEQTYWAGTTLAAMLGHFGLPGGGIVYGYGVFNSSFKERKRLTFSVGALPQGSNPVRDYIPVARLTDMLERPGDAFDYNGNRLTYPDIGLIYWAGGNPFHHHQDLNRLDRVWGKPETIIVHDMYWTATARRADIVFPVATPLERNDFAASTFDSWITPMHRIAAPLGDARTDYDVFSALADRLGYRDAFTEGRDEMQWVRRLYEMTASNAARADVTLPDFDTFWHGDPIDLRPQLPDLIATFEAFRADPLANPLKTPSGKLQLYSDAIADFQYEDCKGHAAWFDKTEWLGAKGRYPLHLISSQPPARLHSQLDHGDVSRGQKIRGREPVRMNPFDARERGIADGDVVRLFNDRGAALAGVRLSDSVMPGVVQLPTGAWFDPHDVEGRPLDVHGNPNALTRDVGTSRLAQGTTAHSCMCDVELFDQPLPDIGVHRLPRIIQKSDLIADSAHGAVAGTPVMGRPASANLPVGKSP